MAYRAPDDNDFYTEFEGMVSIPWRRRKNILILIDLNSDMLRRNASSVLGQKGKKLQRVLNRLGLTNMIKEPTRIAEATETLIDLILTSNVSKVVKAGSVELSISDHTLVYCVINLQQIRKKPQIKYSRNYKKKDINGFRETLKTTPWWVSSVSEETGDVLNAWELLYNNTVAHNGHGTIFFHGTLIYFHGTLIYFHGTLIYFHGTLLYS